MSMRRVFVVLFLAFVATLTMSVDVHAQRIEDKRYDLIERTVDGDYVRVVESIEVQSAVADVEAKIRRKDVDGYRVVIFSANGQYAGDNARKVLEQFQQSYPHINAYMVYESPYFKVSVGDCLTLEEASNLMSQLSREYPDLFPRREVIKFEELANARPYMRELPDSVALFE